MESSSRLLVLLPLACALGCRASAPSASPDLPALSIRTDAPATEVPALPTAAAAQKLVPVTIVPSELPPDLAKLPRLSFRSPASGAVTAQGKASALEVKLAVTDFPVAKDGAYVALLLDGLPFRAITEAQSTTKLGDLLFGSTLVEGSHALYAVPMHASGVAVRPIKGRSPVAVTPITVGKPGKRAFSASAPGLVYLRPKGFYTGRETSEILLDFYVANATLGEGKFAVRATITPPVGEPQALTITRWVPHLIQHLPTGDTKVKLELLDKAGKLAGGAAASVERTITVIRDAAP